MASSSENPEKVNRGWSNKTMPEGVYALKLEGWTRRSIGFPENETVRALILDKDAKEIYEEFAEAVEKAPRKKTTGGYAPKTVEEIRDRFVDRFNEKGILLFFCTHTQYLQSGYVTHKWLEFADSAVAPDYVPKELFDPKKICSVQ